MRGGKLQETLGRLSKYGKGEHDQRPWGFYQVLDAGVENGQDFCKKKIGVKPFSAMSLQRHHGRSEIITVETGTLSLIIDGALRAYSKGENVVIPKGAVHCLMNLSTSPLVITEKQIGICREEDNDRLCDMNGRQTVTICPDDDIAHKSIELYTQVTGVLGRFLALAAKDDIRHAG